MKIGSLFSGIGGLELGLEWSGIGEVVWQCEIDPFCRSVLAKHWPHVRRFDDVRGLTPPPADLICGGFPCQDVSSGNTRGAKGLAGKRSGLWREFARIAKAIAPKIIVVENVASGARRWLPFVRRDLHVLGYRTRAYALSASEVGAPFRRRRIFVVARLDREGESSLPVDAKMGGASSIAPDVDGERGGSRCSDRRSGQAERRDDQLGSGPHAGGGFEAFADVDGIELRKQSRRRSGSSRTVAPVDPFAGWWPAQPEMVRVVPGLSGRVVRACGNAVVPQCAEIIGRIIRSEVA